MRLDGLYLYPAMDLAWPLVHPSMMEGALKLVMLECTNIPHLHGYKLDQIYWGKLQGIIVV